MRHVAQPLIKALSRAYPWLTHSLSRCPRGTRGSPSRFSIATKKHEPLRPCPRCPPARSPCARRWQPGDGQRNPAAPRGRRLLSPVQKTNGRGHEIWVALLQKTKKKKALGCQFSDLLLQSLTFKETGRLGTAKPIGIRVTKLKPRVSDQQAAPRVFGWESP